MKTGSLHYYLYNWRLKELLKPRDLSRIWVLRKLLAEMKNIESMEFLLERLSRTKTNREFLDTMST